MKKKQRILAFDHENVENIDIDISNPGHPYV